MTIDKVIMMMIACRTVRNNDDLQEMKMCLLSRLERGGASQFIRGKKKIK